MDKILELRQRLAGVVAQMRTLANGDFTADDEAKFKDLEAEKVSIDAAIARQETVLAAEASLSRIVDQPVRQQPAADQPRQQWAHIGEYLSDVLYRPHLLNEMRMDTGANGGFLVPPEFSAELLKFDPETIHIRPGARVIAGGSEASITFPAQNQGALGVHGGVTVAWIAEGATKPETEPRLHQVTLSPFEVAGHVIVTDQLLRNSGAAALVADMLRDALYDAEDAAFIAGTGIGQPLGILNAPATISVARAGAGAIITADTLNMLEALHPSSIGSAVWLCSQSALASIAVLADANNNAIFYQGKPAAGLPATLWGMPIKFTGKVSTIGNAGDLMLVDRKHYLIKDGVGPIVAASEHMLFTTNRTVIKIFKTVDGQPWCQAPLTLEDGATQVSPFVVLQ